MVDQITAERLAQRLDGGELARGNDAASGEAADFALVDTRPSAAFDAWHLPGAANVPYHPDEGLSEDDRERVRSIADGRPVVAICGKGLTSTGLAFDLEAAGFDEVTVVAGGMRAYAGVHEVVPIETGREDLVVRQCQRRGTGCLGYVVGSRSTGEAAAIDPTRQVEVFEVAAQEAGLTIEHVLDTHVHADHVSGGPALAERVDAPYYLGERARERGVERAFEPLADGDVVRVGDVDLTTIRAPGHTSEMVAYRIGDACLATGDALFVDSVGRTELQFGDEGAREGARRLHRTLHERLLSLPDETRVLPGHVSVGADGRWATGRPGEALAATLESISESVDLLALDEDAFVDRVVADAGEKPANYDRIVAINEGRASPEEERAAGELELGPNNCAA